MTRAPTATGYRSATRSCAARPRPAWSGSARWSASTPSESTRWLKLIASRSCRKPSAGAAASPARPAPAAGARTSAPPSRRRCTQRWALPWSSSATRSTSRSPRRANSRLRAGTQPLEPAGGEDEAGDLRVTSSAGMGTVAGGERPAPGLAGAQLLDQRHERHPVAGAEHPVGVGELGDAIVLGVVADRRRADDEAAQPQSLRPQQHLFEREQRLLLGAAPGLVAERDVVDAEGEDDPG